MIRFERKRHQRKRRQLSIGENNFLLDSSCYYCCCCYCCCVQGAINWFSKCFSRYSINQCTDAIEQNRNKHSFNDDINVADVSVYDYFNATDDIIDSDANDRTVNFEQITIERSYSTIDIFNKPTAALTLDVDEIVSVINECQCE